MFMQNNLKQNKISFIIHPILFSIYPIIFIFSENINHITCNRDNSTNKHHSWNNYFDGIHFKNKDKK